MVKNQTYKEVKIQANSRLHLGFLNLNNVDQYSYGGIGVSIDKYPTISLISKSKKFESNLSKQLNNRIFKYLQDNNLATDIKIECIKKPTSHIGLGSGTQLKLSIEELISKYYGMTENINIFNRTYRSGIGLNTFKRGGFIIDSPKKDLNNSHMVFRNSFPAAWKAILIFDRKKVGLHGKSEKLFFSPSNSNDIRKQLSDILINKLVPAILHKDFDIFAKGLSKFQKLNHQFYSSVQKSMYSSSDISKVIKHINNRFIVGTGQSSWGPTSYMFIDSRRDLNDILSVLDRAISMYNNLSYDVVSVKNNGRKLTLT